MGIQQTNIFEFLYEPFRPKKIRLYQFFAGIGSQAKALKNLGVEFEDYKIAEWAVPSIKAYNYIHTKDFTDYSQGKSREELIQIVKNVSLDYDKPISEKQLNSKTDEWVREVYNHIIATHNLVNIMEVHGKDLEIDTNYTNIIFYSFPCQDLSKAGLRAGLKASQKEGGTRSGLLWEIERIINELTERERESCVLICENVPDLVEVNFVKDFSKWVSALEKLGFTSYDQILNAKDYGIPQNRKRVFMVSLPGQYSYTFPRRLPLEYRLKDFLEKKVDEKYFLSQKMLNGMINTKFHQYQLKARLQDIDKEVDTLTTATGARCPHLVPTDNIMKLGSYQPSSQCGAQIVSEEGIAPTVMENHGNITAIPTKNLKQELCDKVIESGEVKEMDIINHGYSKSRLSEERKLIENHDEMPSLTTRPDILGVVVEDKIPIKNNNSQGYELAENGDGIDISGRMEYHRGTVQKGCSQTINTMGGADIGVIVDDRDKKI